MPALLVAGEDDDFIGPHHARQISEHYGGDSQVLTLPGHDHNSMRPSSMFEQVGRFLINAMQVSGRRSSLPARGASLLKGTHTRINPPPRSTS
jgi:hypothetical protein